VLVCFKVDATALVAKRTIGCDKFIPKLRQQSGISDHTGGQLQGLVAVIKHN
jgi:hypothetical protein